MEKETKIILKAKKEYGLDFENPQAMAQKAEDEGEGEVLLRRRIKER